MTHSLGGILIDMSAFQKVEEKKSSPGPTIWSTIHENGLNISQAVVIDAIESKRLFLQLENEVWN